jgi:hypothetical protein
MSEIDMDVSFDWMLNSYKGELKNVKGLTKPLLFLTNISASQAKELSSEIGVHFICIVKEPLNDNDFLSKSVIVYNQKTKKFTNYKNKPEDFNNFEAEIVQRFKETQNERNLRAKIQEVTTKANRIYECLALDLFITLSNEVNSLTPFEYDFIRDFIPKYFRISLDALPPYRQNSTIINSIPDDPTKLSLKLTNPNEKDKDKDKDNDKDNDKNKDKLWQKELNQVNYIKEEKIFVENKSNNEDVKKDGKNSKSEKKEGAKSKQASDQQYIKELNLIRKPKGDFSAIFDYCLDSMRYFDNYKHLTDPVALYIALRKTKWQDSVPSQFLMELYRTKINSNYSRYPNMTHEDYILMLEETKDSILSSIKPLPFPVDFEDELVEYIRRIIMNKTLQDDNESFNNIIQKQKDSYIAKLNEKYMPEQIEIISSANSFHDHQQNFTQNINKSALNQNILIHDTVNLECQSDSVEHDVKMHLEAIMQSSNSEMPGEIFQVETIYLGESNEVSDSGVGPDSQIEIKYKSRHISALEKLNNIFNSLETCLKLIGKQL